MLQSMSLSLIVLRKSMSNGVSIGDGHTLLVRTPRAIVLRAERIVYTCTSSFEKKYGSTPRSRPSNQASAFVPVVDVEQLVDRLESRSATDRPRSTRC